METSAFDPPPRPRPYTCVRGDRAQSAAYGDTCLPTAAQEIQTSTFLAPLFQNRLSGRGCGNSFGSIESRGRAGQCFSLAVPLGRRKRELGASVRWASRACPGGCVCICGDTESGPAGTTRVWRVLRLQRERERKTSCASVAWDSFATRLHAEAEPPASLLSSQGHSLSSQGRRAGPHAEPSATALSGCRLCPPVCASRALRAGEDDSGLTLAVPSPC